MAAFASPGFDGLPDPGAGTSRQAAPPRVDATRMAAGLGLTPTIAGWLLRRGFADDEITRRFLDPKLAHLTQPDAMADRAAAADRLARAVVAGERICVFGDYDCDGITSAAVMTEILRELGGEVVPLLASRFDGGYGVSAPAVRRILDARPGVLVTCDCGSSDHASLADIVSRGVDVIVIDHHLVPDEPLPALAFLNPHRQECGFSYKGLASCGLALSVGAALRAALRRPLDVRRWLDLVAIGTIADVAPLDGDNRALVRAGLALMRTAPRPGVRALLELSRRDGLAPLRGDDVAFGLAPRINAPGRLGAPDVALQLLLARSDESARALAADVEQLTVARRTAQAQMVAEATEEVDRSWRDRPALVIGREGWNPGIVGIVAGRLADAYRRPVIVVGFGGELGRGSVRGPAGFPLHDALSLVGDCVERFGGHQAAAGLDVRLDRLDELREGFERAVETLGAPAASGEEDRVELHPRDDPYRVLLDLERLEPCGHSNPAPRLVVDAKVDEARPVRGGHLKLDLALESGARLSAFGVAMGEEAPNLAGSVRLLGRLRRDRFHGGDAAELFVEAVLG